MAGGHKPSTRPSSSSREAIGRLSDLHFSEFVMAKPTTAKIRLNSEGGSGFFYVTKKNTRTMTEKFSIKKYDPVLRKHVQLKEGRSSSLSCAWPRRFRHAVFAYSR